MRGGRRLLQTRDPGFAAEEQQTEQHDDGRDAERRLEAVPEREVVVAAPPSGSPRSGASDGVDRASIAKPRAMVATARMRRRDQDRST